ncbi:Tfp pilus assembly protein PilW [Legionella lansingensis]|uniref:Tfp pilus assembly protein PilW n=1 Tax=Legionella lansingensis TaxID=45067 RepID=A0A0W0W0L6_9GAMM|nr:hypothetical protein [Legionella lansingensis]KTD25785.1 hypothetical protein Llan_0054 [Legionella lansingensis]SNV52151.1 Tfp pilus assembly protein PilW [Legionella lansingensis]
MCKQNGLSLVEIMLSLFLGILLLTALAEHYLTAKSRYRHAYLLFEQGLELELVEDLIRNSARRAGFTPCLNLNLLNSCDYRRKKPLRAIEIGVRPDALSIQRMSEYFSLISEVTPEMLIVPSGVHFTTGEWIVIADCYHAEVQQVSYVRRNAGKTVLGLSKSLGFEYTAPVYLGEWIKENFFIQKNHLGEKALYYQRDHAEELTPAVNKLSAQLQYNHGLSLLRVELGLKNKDNLIIETKIRS